MRKFLEQYLGRDVSDDVVPSLTPKEAQVLRALKNGGEQYGLELVKNSGGKLKRGTIYVVLGQLEDKGFIECRLEPKHEKAIGKPRRLYQINGAGERVLAQVELIASRLVGEVGSV